MFSFFSKKDGYHEIPDTIEVSENQAEYNTDHNMNPRTTDHRYGHIDYRGDKRLIERGGDFHQSTGKIALRKKIKRRYFRALYGMDLFHSLVDAPTTRIIAILMGTYMSLVVSFAVVYYLISITWGCNLDITNFAAACFFSLETMATIGYSTKDIFFDDCIITLIVLSFQICVKLIADAVTIGVIYCKLSRPHARASTVIFSDKGVIRRIRGKLYFMFQLCELRKHQLVEAHVRVYCVRKEVDLASCFAEDEGSDSEDESVETLNTLPDLAPRRSSVSSAPGNGSSGFSFNLNLGFNRSTKNTSTAVPDEETGLLPGKSFSKMEYHTLPELPSDGLSGGWENRAQRPSYMQTCAMRLNHPNDEMGGMLLLMTPQVVVHEIDAGSPLMPPPVWYSNYPTGEFSRAFSEFPSPWQHQQPHDGEMGPGASVSGLGVHEEGDCIRWRPPAYRGFIHHIPAHQLPYYHTAQEQSDPQPASTTPTVRFQNEHVPAKGVTNSLIPKPQRSLHRYNADSSADDFNTSWHKMDYEGTGTGDPVQSWYYDAEALARIEFPSVTRRIDTDNITAGAPATTASGYGEYATAAATAGMSSQQQPHTGSTGSGGIGQRHSSMRVPGNSNASEEHTGIAPPPLQHPRSLQPHGSSANLRDEEGRAVGDWSLQSAGLSGYADLLNPSPSGLRSASTSYLNLRAALHVDSPLSKSHARLPSMNANSMSFMLSQHRHSAPTTPVNSATDTIKAKKKENVTSPLSMDEPEETKSPLLSINEGMERVKPTISPVSRIPVLSRPNSSFSLLTGVSLPTSSSPAGITSSSLSQASPSAASAISTPESTPTASPSKISLTNHSSVPTSSMEITTSPLSPTADVAGTTGNSETKRSLTRTKSKRDSYVSPYKQALRQSSTPTVSAEGSKTVENSVPVVNEATVEAVHPPVLRTAPVLASTAAGNTAMNTHSWSRPVPQPPLPQGQGPQPSTTTGLKVGGAGIDAGHHHHHHHHAPAAAGVGATDSMYNSWQSEERHMVQRYMRDRQIEIIVIVEGVDAATGGNVQARHSYTSDELEWDKSFQCCVFKDPKDGCPTIDFSLFHELLDVPPDAPFAGVVHSSI